MEFELAVIDALGRIDDAQAKVAAAKADLIPAIMNVSRVADKRERLRIVRNLYWVHDVHAGALALALMFDDIEFDASEWPALEKKSRGLIHKLIKMVSPGYSIECATDGCDNRCYVNSRTQYHRLLQSLKHLPAPFSDLRFCAHCMEVKTSIRDKAWEARDAEWRRGAAARKAEEERQRQELADMEAKLNLTDEERERFYELLSREFARQDHIAYNEGRA